MIGYLKGNPLVLRPDSVLLDVGGVGYALAIPLSTYYALESSSGQPVELYVHTHLREDELALFGFSTEREKLLFEKLISVSGVGPRLARVILSGMPPEEVIGALAVRDAVRLTRIPGVGRKTAERLVLELSDKIQEVAAALPAGPPASADSDVISALVNLGYKPILAEKAVAEARSQVGLDAEFHQLLRQALQRLSRV